MPSVDLALQHPRLQTLLETRLRGEVLTAIRDVLAAWRAEILDDAGNGRAQTLCESPAETILEHLSDRVVAHLEHAPPTAILPAVNATGVVLHTNLGRAVLAPEALEAVKAVSESYCLLEMDRESGKRSKRDVHVVPLFRELTGAEAVTFVNNNAGATLIILDTLASGKDVLLSRGEMVEIGGSFRIPDIMEKSGARLVGVGTTNRTHLHDYERAIGENTAAILRVHPSNYQVIGFTKSPPLADLVALGRKHGIPVVDDLGSGCLADLGPAGLDEPLLHQSLSAGADVVCFSTDKLLGGPQGGGIAGKKDLVERIRRNPLARALRMDKLRLAALEATLRLYRDSEVARARIPTVGMILMTSDEAEKRARSLARKIRRGASDLRVGVTPSSSNVGGGSLPGQDIPTWVVAVTSPRDTAEVLSHLLRRNDPPVIARIHKDEVLFDPRTLLPGQDAIIAEALARIGSGPRA